MDIKSLLENDNYIIVLDTNVLLNIYRYSPEFSEFALNCLQAVKDDIVLPVTVRLEYGKHCRAEFSKMQDRAKNAGNETADQIKRSKEKVLATCDKLERLRFPDVDDLRDSLSSKLDETQIVYGELKETEYNERWDEEPEYGELGTCPNCGCPLDTWNDAGGFCVKCAIEQE